MIKSKKIQILSILLVFCILFTLLSGSIAYFTDRTGKIVSSTAGNVVINLDSSGINLLDEDGKDILNPGDGRDFSYTIYNLGNKSVDIKETIVLSAYDKNSQPLNLSNTQSEFEIYRVEDVIYDDVGYWHPIEGAEPIEVKVLENNVITYTRPMYTLSGDEDLNNIEREIEYDNSTEIPSFKQNDFKLVFKLGSSNETQGCILFADLVVEAKQHRNTSFFNNDWSELQSASLTVSNGNVINVVPSLADSRPLVSADNAWVYRLNQNVSTATLIDTNLTVGADETLVIPEKVDDKQVTDIEIDNIMNNDNISSSATLEFKNPQVIKNIEGIFTYTTDVEGVHITGLTKSLGSRLSVVTIPETIDGLRVVDVDYQGIVDTTGVYGVGYKRLEVIYTDEDVISEYGADLVLEFSDNGDGTASITDLTDLGEMLATPYNIPETINGLTVTTFKDSSFMGGQFTEIITPDTLTTIESMAFYNSSNLNKVILNEGLTSIGQLAFQYSSLTEVTIPSTVTSIKYHAFKDCSNLRTVNYNSKAAPTIRDSQTIFYGSPIETLNLGAGITTIPNNLLYGMDNISNININSVDDIVAIGNSTFRNCSGLTDITFNGVIDENIVFPNTVKKIGQYTFTGCNSLNIVLTGVTTIENYAFQNSTISSIILNDGLTSIGMNSFSNCTAISEITIPASVKSILRSAFSGWTADQTIYVEGKTSSSEFSQNVGLTSGCNATVIYKG